MMQPIQGTPTYPPGALSASSGAAGEQPLSPQQRTVLERLIIRLISLTHQQGAEVWASMRHDLGMKSKALFLSRHFPAAEHNLKQKLTCALEKQATRQVLQQLTELLGQGNNRQAVSDFIRQHFGHTALSQLTQEQLRTVLTLLKEGQIAIPQPQRSLTDRPLLPAEHKTLNQAVAELAAATGESGKLIWQSMLELSGVKPGELIPAKNFTLLNTWLQARLTLSQQTAPTLNSVQTALTQPLDQPEWREIVDYAQQRWQATPHAILTTVQVQDILNQVFLRRAEHAPDFLEPRDVQSIYNPLIVPFVEPFKWLSSRPGLAMITLVIVMLLVWIAI